MINSLIELYIAFDEVYDDILPVCISCIDHDCEGYIWILPDEESALSDVGAEIIEVNGDCGICNFINPLKSYTPSDFEQMKPKCPLRVNGLCSVYNVRPLVCRIYPVGFLRIDGEVSIILSKDCAYSRALSGKKKKQFVDNILGVFDRCSQTLYDNIVGTYSIVDGYFKYPDGPNEYEVIGKL